MLTASLNCADVSRRASTEGAAEALQGGVFNGDLGADEASSREVHDDTRRGNGMAAAAAEANGSATPDEAAGGAGLSVSTGREGAGLFSLLSIKPRKCHCCMKP